MTPTDTLSALLESQAALRPTSPAIGGLDRPWLSFAALAQQVRAVAAALRSRGIGRHQRVAVVAPNGPEMAVAVLAVSCAASCAPLNPEYRRPEYDYYLSSLRIDAVLIPQDSQGAIREAAFARNIPVLEFVVEPGTAAGRFKLVGAAAAAAFSDSAQPSDIALLLHTSGTTSRPKIVPLTHANLCAAARNIAKAIALGEGDRCLNIMPLFYVSGLSTVFSSLASGSQVFCVPPFDATQFFAWLERAQPTWTTAAPTLYQAILAEAQASGRKRVASSLRLIRTTSAGLPPSVMRALEELFDRPVIQSYGMTEASPQITSNPLPPGERKPLSAGLPAGTEVAIMDDDGRLLPQGETGEIVIRGANVFSGYEGQPQVNAQVFTRGWLRTGDLGLLDGDGYLFIRGRAKEIINRGGQKISPREVDEELLEHPAVLQGVAFAMPHPTLGEELYAAVVLKSGESVSGQAIREFLLNRLVPFKVPSEVLVVPDLPIGDSAKIQRARTAERFGSWLRSEYAAPRTDIEQHLAQLWSDILGIEKVGIHDNFFAAGGDSLRAARLVAQVRAQWGVELSPAAVFATPTIALFSAQLATQSTQNDVEELADVLAQIEGLSDEEVNRLLAEEAARNG